MSAVFREFGADWNTMMLDISQVENVFSALALPVDSNEVQRAVKQTLVVSENKIGFLKFCRYVLKNCRRLCKKWRIQRMRIMADLLLSPPVEEARIIILDLAAFERRNEMRKLYRQSYLKEVSTAVEQNNKIGSDNTENLQVRFHLCHFCGLRFSNQKNLMRHKVRRAHIKHLCDGCMVLTLG
jgi:hypothetical protein